MSTATVLGDVSAGVKKDDWITYQVNVSGDVPADHDLKSAVMNVTDVQGSAISIDMINEFNNGTIQSAHVTFNLATGVLGDNFFIPPNLNVGDQFYDAYQGNITITDIEKQTIAGAERTVVLGATAYTNYVWDRATGVLVAAESMEPDYSVVTNTNGTNIWQPDILGFQPSVFYAVLVTVVIVIAVLAVLSFVWIKQKKQRPLLFSLQAAGAVFTAVFLAAYLGGMFMTPSTTVLHSEPAFRIALFVIGAAFLVLILTSTIMALREKSLKARSALKAGLLIVAAAYFLFNFHSLFTLEWIGEWDRIANGTLSSAIFLEDMANTVGITARFIAGTIAIAAAAFYFFKGQPSTQKTYRILRWILVLEAVYWISLIPTAGVNIYFALTSTRLSAAGLLSNLAWTTLPSIIESIVAPAALLILAKKLNSNKPDCPAIKWALISGTIYILVFWLTNMGAWMLTVAVKGTGYLTNYPQHMFSFIITIGGLFVLALYGAYFTKKSNSALTWQEVNLRGAGTLITLLGLYYLWNYLSWIFFGGNHIWSDWYAWSLGHNLDLWMLSLPLLGIPLLFYRSEKEKSYA